MHRQKRKQTTYVFFLVVSVIACSIAVAGLFGNGLAQEKKQYMADRHQGKNVGCAACHGEQGAPQGDVPSATCLTCHGDEEKLAMKTAAVRPNPHDSHLGAVECTKCHRGHKSPEDACGKCHNFGFNLR